MAVPWIPLRRMPVCCSHSSLHRVRGRELGMIAIATPLTLCDRASNGDTTYMVSHEDDYYEYYGYFYCANPTFATPIVFVSRMIITHSLFVPRITKSQVVPKTQPHRRMMFAHSGHLPNRIRRKVKHRANFNDRRS